VKRAFNSTFHEPPQEVQQARSQAASLRMTLGQTITQMELAYHEALRLLKAAKTSGFSARNASARALTWPR